MDAAVKSNILFLETKGPFLKFLGRTLNEVSTKARNLEFIINFPFVP